MVAHNNSILPGRSDDNYILSAKGLADTAQFLRRNNNSQMNHDGTSDTSSSVKEKKMIRIIKTTINVVVALSIVLVAQQAVEAKFDKLKQARQIASPVTAQMRQTQ